MTISELLEELGKNKQTSAEIYKAYKSTKVEEELLKIELMARLQEAGLKSAKGRDFQAVVVETPSIVVKDERRVLEWLQERPEIESDFYIGLRVPEFKSLATTMLKQTGELADGTDVEVRESLSIRANKKGK